MITVYSKDTCGYCTSAKQYLEEHNIEYKEVNLDLVGLMCIPPANTSPESYFNQMKQLNKSLGFRELSMGMSSDYIKAAENLSTYLRIGSSIFGERI